MYRIGIDVGGTNTDAAILDTTSLSTLSRGVLATCKTPTTPDVTGGIKTAVETVILKSGVNRDQVQSVAIGTTHFINAVVEADPQRLSKVAVVRLCGPYTREIPPFADFPNRLKGILEGPSYYLDGGLEIDGQEIDPLNPEQVETTTALISDAGIKTVALVGIFSALDHAGIHEERCKSMMLKHCPNLSIVCSHTIGGPGLLARENATILNASILNLAAKTVNGFRRAMAKLGVSCPLYLTQNDGTLTDAAAAAELPVKTFASGPTNSMTGAAFLHGLLEPNASLSDKQVLVVDIGGTTTDICALLPSGFPRQAPNFVEVGGVRTAFSMPEVFSVGLGGGSRVRVDAATGKVGVGPDSVGYRLNSEAKVFGGETLTTTDIAVACGVADIGDPSRVDNIPSKTVSRAREEIKKILERAIEDMKVSSAPVVMLLVGGGSVVQMDELEGVVECVCPPHHDSANAVGAAIAKVAGEADIIEVLADRDAIAIEDAAKKMAVDAAIAKGADPTDVKIVEMKKIPLQYVTNKATRFVIKAVGSLMLEHTNLAAEKSIDIPDDEIEQLQADEKRQAHFVTPDMPVQNLESLGRPSLGLDISKYRPEVKGCIWYLSPIDVEFIACGCGVLGTGGGGSSYNASLVALNLLKDGGRGKMRVVSPVALKDDDLCVFGAGYGAPSVSEERIHSGTEIIDAVQSLNDMLGYRDFQGIVADEIGGGNGLATFRTSVEFDRPIVDADLMGRAYPTMEHGTPYVYGEPAIPAAMADGKGNVSVVVKAQSNKKVEGMLRTTCVELGNSVAVAGRPLSGQAIKKYAIPNTVSQAWFLGRAVHLARRNKVDLIEAIAEVTPVRLLYTGKIIDVTRDVSKGYTVGRCVIAPISGDEEDHENSTATSIPETRKLVIPFQNEYLYAAYLDPGDEKNETKEDVICTVPDLISILGQDGEALGSPELRFGLRVRVIGMPAHPLWTGTKQGLKVGGPEFFGLPMCWKSVGEYQVPLSVIEEFS